MLCESINKALNLHFLFKQRENFEHFKPLEFEECQNVTKPMANGLLPNVFYYSVKEEKKKIGWYMLRIRCNKNKHTPYKTNIQIAKTRRAPPEIIKTWIEQIELRYTIFSDIDISAWGTTHPKYLLLRQFIIKRIHFKVFCIDSLNMFIFLSVSLFSSFFVSLDSRFITLHLFLFSQKVQRYFGVFFSLSRLKVEEKKRQSRNV